MKRLFFYIFIIVLIGRSYVSTATSLAWLVRVWQTDDGLPDNNVSSIVQGLDGYLWIITPAGLNRFDGVNFSPFPIEDFTRLAVPHVREMLCSRTGVLWVASDGGTVIGLNPDFSTVPFSQADLPKHGPHALAESSDGSLWLGYTPWPENLSSIYRINGGKVRCFTAKDGMPDGPFYSLVADGAGDIWVAKGNQLVFFQNGKFQKIVGIKGLQCLGASHTNAVWFVTGTHLFKSDTQGELRDCGCVFQSSVELTVTALLEDKEGSVWIGTDGDGLFHYSRSGFERVEASHSSILSLAEDREGNIWAGTAGGGLDRVCPKVIRLEAAENNEVSSQLQSIAQDTHGVLWGVTHDGMMVSRIDDSWEPVLTNAPIAGTVTCVAADHDGSVWAGTRDGKVLHLVNKTCSAQDTKWSQIRPTVDPSIRALLSPAPGELWVVGRSRVKFLKNGHLQSIKLPPHVSNISAIAEDAFGNLWIAANSALIRFDGTNFVDEAPRLLSWTHPICCLYGTADGSMWIGSRGGGLLQFSDGQFGQVGIEQGLLNNFISQITADGHGWLWFGSDHGIFKIKQRELAEAIRNPAIYLHPIVYGRNEGLISLDAVFSTAPPYVLPNAICSNDGRVWILTYSGVVIADPKLLAEDMAPPPVVLTKVVKDGQTIAFYGGAASTQTGTTLKTLNIPLLLPPSYSHLEFDFTAFHFTAPENIRFRYQLGGFDKSWIDAGTGRSASYSRLAAGDYEFRVEACVGDGSWGETPATISFTVAPFFWQTWWFRLGVFSFFSLSLTAIVRYVSLRRLRLKLLAMEKQAAVERERGRIARDIHDDLGNRLTEIQLLTSLARRKLSSEKVSDQVQKISATARQATDALDEIVWAINPRNDNLSDFISYVEEFARDFLRAADIQCRVDLTPHPPAEPISAEVRHNLFLAIKESLNNVVNHANATEVFLRILIMDESISVIIEDNGRGMNGAAKGGGGDGLGNMRQRISEIGGQFQVKTSASAGTSISFTGPWLAKK